jgi:hypothetical protein
MRMTPLIRNTARSIIRDLMFIGGVFPVDLQNIASCAEIFGIIPFLDIPPADSGTSVMQPNGYPMEGGFTPFEPYSVLELAFAHRGLGFFSSFRNLTRAGHAEGRRIEIEV